MSREASKLLNDLVGPLVHDLNNLLATILACGDLLTERAEDDEARKDFAAIVTAAEQLMGLSQSLRTLGEEPSDSQGEFDLNELVGNLQLLLERVVGIGYSLDVSLAGGVATVWADRHEIERLLLNLVLNARDAMPKGGTVRVRTEIGSVVRLIVSDDGVGMTDDQKARLLQPRYSTKQDTEGSGHGLSSLRSLVAGGSVVLDVVSQPGSGTALCLEFDSQEESESEGWALLGGEDDFWEEERSSIRLGLSRASELWDGEKTHRDDPWAGERRTPTYS